jgi:hypothetical protein
MRHGNVSKAVACQSPSATGHFITVTIRRGRGASGRRRLLKLFPAIIGRYDAGKRTGSVQLQRLNMTGTHGVGIRSRSGVKAAGRRGKPMRLPETPKGICIRPLLEANSSQ